jgi:hypothetical protein
MALRRTAALLLLACVLGAVGALAARDFEVSLCRGRPFWNGKHSTLDVQSLNVHPAGQRLLSTTLKRQTWSIGFLRVGPPAPEHGR